ncbi:hypothetical protein AC1031_001930 [Aphanomyces cochlioides]|nr:hypothetical protein AC1031_001930 [Aphanomyces cochlioides]
MWKPLIVLLWTVVCISGQALFPGTSACQRCANDPTQCSDAYKGLPGKYCGPWLSGGVKQACCCPPAAGCVIPIKADSCGCDSNPQPMYSSSSKGIPFWVWILVAVGVISLSLCIWRCCCVTEVVAEPVFVPAGGVAYVSQPAVVPQPVYGYGGYGGPAYAPAYGYSGGQVAAGMAVGAAAGLVGGALIGEAIADHGYHGDYGGGGYDGGYDGGGGGGADFGGDF